MCTAEVRSSAQMGRLTINGNAMRRSVVHSLGVTLLLSGLALFGVGCSSTSPAGTALPELPAHAAPPVRDRGLELTTLRSELAATRIAAAKKEAELIELRDLVRQLRLENAESRQAFLELRDQAEQRQRESVKARDIQERHAQADSTQDLTVLKATVAALAQEFGQLRQDLAMSVANEQVKLPVAMTVTAATVPASSSIIIVQPGDTLASLAKRHRTTVTALRALNGLLGDQLVVGKELILP